MKKIMLGTSNTWLMKCLSQQPREPAYCIEDCWTSSNEWLCVTFSSCSGNVQIQKSKHTYIQYYHCEHRELA